jgi:hypothetical protein
MHLPRPFRRLAPLAAALAALAAGGCGQDGSFPSLEPRAIESEDPLAEPVRTPPVVASEPAVRARADALLAEARTGDRAFEAAYARAAAAAGRAGAPGSESWVEAQQAISRAEAARAATGRALAELDRLAAERARVPTNESDMALVRSTLEAVEAIAATQQQRLDRLRGTVRR